MLRRAIIGANAGHRISDIAGRATLTSTSTFENFGISEELCSYAALNKRGYRGRCGLHADADAGLPEDAYGAGNFFSQIQIPSPRG